MCPLKYVYTKGTLKKDQRKIYLMMLTQCFCVFLVFFLIFFIKAYVVGTHLKCIDKSVHFKLVPTTYAFIKKYIYGL